MVTALNDRQRMSLRLAFERAARLRASHRMALVTRRLRCGKTHLAASIANECLSRGQPVLFVNVPDLLDHLRATTAPILKSALTERLKRSVTRRCLSWTIWARRMLRRGRRKSFTRFSTIATMPNCPRSSRPIKTWPILTRACARACCMSSSSSRSRSWRQTIVDGVDQAQPELSSLQFHRDQTFDSFSRRADELPPQESDNLERALALAQHYAAEPRDWLLFTAPMARQDAPGGAIANHRNDQSYPVLFVVVPDLLDHLRAAFNPSSPVSYDKRLKKSALRRCSCWTTWAPKAPRLGRAKSSIRSSTIVRRPVADGHHHRPGPSKNSTQTGDAHPRLDPLHGGRHHSRRVIAASAPASAQAPTPRRGSDCHSFNGLVVRMETHRVLKATGK